LRHIARKVYDRLVAAELSGMVKDRMSLIKFAVRSRIEGFIQDEVDRLTHMAFERLFDAGRIQFYLQCAECRFPIPESVEVRSTRPLTHDNGDRLERSLFDYVEHEGQNNYERAVALCLD